jgi:hypothetical protein
MEVERIWQEGSAVAGEVAGLCGGNILLFPFCSARGPITTFHTFCSSRDILILSL